MKEWKAQQGRVVPCRPRQRESQEAVRLTTRGKIRRAKARPVNLASGGSSQSRGVVGWIQLQSVLMTVDPLILPYRVSYAIITHKLPNGPANKDEQNIMVFIITLGISSDQQESSKSNRTEY